MSSTGNGAWSVRALCALTTLTLIGCNGSVTHEQYERAGELCAPFGGIKFVESRRVAFNEVAATCKGGVDVHGWTKKEAT